jgi:hypothetical protein
MMQRMFMRLSALTFALVVTGHLFSQSGAVKDSSDRLQPQDLQGIKANTIHQLSAKYGGLEETVTGQSTKVLDRMQRLETNMEAKLWTKDSMAARQLFNNVQQKYEELKAGLQAPVTKLIPRPLQEYIPRLDSLQTLMHFLSQATPGSTGASMANLQQLQGLSAQLQQLQGRFGQAGQIQDFISGREQALQAELTKYNMTSQLLKANKTIYYYQQQLQEYKAMFSDRSKMEQEALGIATGLPAFKSFMQKNSYLGSLFPQTEGYGTPKALAGVPSSADVGNMIAEKMGAAGKKIDPQQYLQQQAQSGNDQLSALKEKVAKAGGGNSDMELPQFAPNTQKTKSFLKRIELGFNIQSQQSTVWLPVTTAFALTAGYRFSDKIVAGVGAAYQLGWGSGIQHIALSNQGVGLRSWLDVKAKGSLWITGGFEYNYMQEFARLADIDHIDVWQKSMLLGISKKYKVGSQTANMQLLYDFLAPYETPRGSPLKFRVGYTF